MKKSSRKSRELSSTNSVELRSVWGGSTGGPIPIPFPTGTTETGGSSDSKVITSSSSTGLSSGDEPGMSKMPDYTKPNWTSTQGQ